MEHRMLMIAVLCVAGIVFLLSSCDTVSTEPTPPGSSLPTLSASNYFDVTLIMVDYDRLRIGHQAGTKLQSSQVCQIEIGSTLPSGYRSLTSSLATYDSALGVYILDYDFAVAMDSTRLTQPVTIRYLLADSSLVEIDTTIALYRFPYETAQIFLDTAVARSVQDIARSETKLFYHGWSDGLHQYDLDAGASLFIYDGYYNGTHITADSGYVFIDDLHQRVVRFNLSTLTVDMTLLDLTPHSGVEGLATFNGSLYVSYTSPDYSGMYIKTFTYQGTLRDSIAYPPSPFSTHFMAIADSIVYSKNYDGDKREMIRFDLRSRTLLSNVRSPASWLFGIEIFKDTLFYCDARKNYVGAIPVSDLIPVE